MQIIAGVAMALYPILVFLGLVVWQLPARTFSLCLLAFGAALALATGRKGTKRSLAFPLFLVTSSLVLFFTRWDLPLKLYPLFVNGTLLVLFLGSVLQHKPIVYRFACMMDRSIPYKGYRASVERYCRRVTLVWVCFFVLNLSASLATIFSGSMQTWALYNGGISYILMGLLFGGEWIVRHYVNKSLGKVVLLSQTKRDSRSDDTLLCYSGRFSDGKYLYWKDYVQDVAKMRAYIEQHPVDRWILHSDDFWFFDVAFAALMQAHVPVILTANIAPAYLDELQSMGDTGTLSDVPAGGAVLIGDILSSVPVPSDLSWKPIDPEASEIFLATSGTTGKPKLVRHTLKEMELDDGFFTPRWGKDLQKRLLVSSVNPHHIFGFLFAGLKPINFAVPFRRERIVTPEELLAQNEDPVTLISTPAFLKRCIEDPDLVNHKPVLKDPFIVVSGGALMPPEAKATSEVLGYWPLEFYGSTETSGIAWRQTDKSVEWEPFDDVDWRIGDDGCLILNSPYVEGKKDFVTSDLCEKGSANHFVLKGRKDSVVKIEEKRISLPEVECRISQLGLTKDVCVIALKDTRQYLAAILVLNEKGRQAIGSMEAGERWKYLRKELSAWLEPVEIPRKWRFVDQIPQNSMGKRRKADLESLFQ